MVKKGIIGLKAVTDSSTNVNLYASYRSAKLTAEDMINEIDSIPTHLQEKIDYEEDRCECCGIHPDELMY